MTVNENFEYFQYFDFETNFLKNESLFFKKLENRFVFESTTIERVTYPYTNTLSDSQKSMLRWIEWGVQNGPMTKNVVLPVSAIFFWKFCFSTITCYKELIWTTNYPEVHIHTCWKRWSFIWECFFHVSILKTYSTATIRNDFSTNMSCFMRVVLFFLHVN